MEAAMDASPHTDVSVSLPCSLSKSTREILCIFYNNNIFI